MNPLEGLAQYLDRLERRLRLFAWTRGAAAVVGAALILTVVIVAVLMMGAFTPFGLILGRFVLFLGIGGAIAATLVVPLMRMNRRRAAQEVEHQIGSAITRAQMDVGQECGTQLNSGSVCRTH